MSKYVILSDQCCGCILRACKKKAISWGTDRAAPNEKLKVHAEDVLSGKAVPRIERFEIPGCLTEDDPCGNHSLHLLTLYCVGLFRVENVINNLFSATILSVNWCHCLPFAALLSQGMDIAWGSFSGSRE